MMYKKLLRYSFVSVLWCSTFIAARKRVLSASTDWFVHLGDTEPIMHYDADSFVLDLDFFLDVAEQRVRNLAPLSIQDFESCSSSIEGSVISAKAFVNDRDVVEEGVNENMSISSVPTNIRIDLRKIPLDTNSTIFTLFDDHQYGEIRFCLRADLGAVMMLDGAMSPMNQELIKFHIQVNAIQGFSPVSVNVVNDDNLIIENNYELKYNVVACQCDIETKTCLPNPPTWGPNSILPICIVTDTPGFVVSGIKWIQVTQTKTNFSFSAVLDYIPNAFTAVDNLGTQIARLITRTVSMFYGPNSCNDNGDLYDLEFRGIVLLDFKGTEIETLQNDNSIQVEAPVSTTIQLSPLSGNIELSLDTAHDDYDDDYTFDAVTNSISMDNNNDIIEIQIDDEILMEIEEHDRNQMGDDQCSYSLLGVKLHCNLVIHVVATASIVICFIGICYLSFQNGSDYESVDQTYLHVRALSLKNTNDDGRQWSYSDSVTNSSSESNFYQESV